MEIKVLEAKLQVSQTSKKEYTNIKTESGYINVWGDHLAEKGKTITITEPEKFGKSLWARIDKSKPPAPPKPEIQEHAGLTRQQYLDEFERIWSFAKKLEPSPEAVTGVLAVCNTYLIALSNGKIVNEPNEPLEDEPYYEPEQ
jgi:hypothetical protein